MQLNEYLSSTYGTDRCFDGILDFSEFIFSNTRILVICCNGMSTINVNNASEPIISKGIIEHDVILVGCETGIFGDKFLRKIFGCSLAPSIAVETL